MGAVMLHEFLDANRKEVIERCRERVARRPAPHPTPQEVEHGIRLFLAELIETLRTRREPGAPGGDKVLRTSRRLERHGPSGAAATAAKHGHDLLRRGFTVDHVVHDYGEVCQAVAELAIERNAPVSAYEFKILNRCLDSTIADAVTEFDRQRERLRTQAGSERAVSERLGFLAHELRGTVNTAMLAFAAIKAGGVGVRGATSAVLERSLTDLRDLIDRALPDVRLSAGMPLQLDEVALDRLIAEVHPAASLEARARGCKFTACPVEPGLTIHADKQMLSSAVSNLLQNAFKFTRPHSHVRLKACGMGDRVLIEVEDLCGSLPAGKAEAMFLWLEQLGVDRSGLGLGLSISRRAVEAIGGKLRVRDMPGIGCVFTIDLPREVSLPGEG
jgi:signal transduction histidine kinase